MTKSGRKSNHQAGRRPGSAASAKPRLLPNEPGVINAAAQDVLTQRYLWPHLTALMTYLLAVRAQVDPLLERAQPFKLGKPYPVGQCLEISLAVKQQLLAASFEGLPAAAAQGLRALVAFCHAGGVVRQVWGDLRGAFFQNAFQVGTLYMDVANDSVTPSKPKVEIVPFAEAGLAPIRDFRHFAQLGACYWQGHFYPNHVLSEWAPVCPFIHVAPSGQLRLVEASQYMVALAQANAYRASEEVLSDAPMPAEVFARVKTYLIGSRWQLPPTATQGRADALRACQEQRAKKRHLSHEQANQAIIAAREINQRLLLSALPAASTPDVPIPTDATPPLAARLQAVDEEIATLQYRLTIYQTARNVYAQALQDDIATMR